EDHAYPLGVHGERQFQPELDKMLLLGPRPAHSTLRWLSLGCDAVVGGEPVVALVAPVEFIEIEPGRLAIIDVPQTRAGKTNAVAAAVANLDQAHKGQEAREMQRVDVPAIWHAPPGRLLDPIVIELPLFRNDKLRLEGRVRRSRHVGSRNPTN